jgi:hypothetical protein
LKHQVPLEALLKFFIKNMGKVGFLNSIFEIILVEITKEFEIKIFEIVLCSKFTFKLHRNLSRVRGVMNAVSLCNGHDFGSDFIDFITSCVQRPHNSVCHPQFLQRIKLKFGLML